MKYYIINSEGKEVSFDLSVLGNTLKSKHFKITDGMEVSRDFYIRNLAGKPFISEDNETWSKLPVITSKSGLVNVNENLNVYVDLSPQVLEIRMLVI